MISFLCNSCVKPFEGKYLQQCKICGHPAHEKEYCTVGQPFSYPVTWRTHPKQRNCSCPQIVDSWGMNSIEGDRLYG